MKILHIDLETFSELDIKQVGLYKYAENCQILLCAFAFDDQPVVIIDLASGESLPVSFINALFDPHILKTAYNAPFEFNVLAHHLHRSLDITQWQCSMVLGLSLGLPAGLDEIGKVLNLSSDKLKISEGKKLINFFSSPIKSKADNNIIDLFHDHSSNRNLPNSHPEKWNAFKDYCKQDVVAERAIHYRLFKFAPPVSEHKLWCLDQKINSYGVLLDLHFVDSAIFIDNFIKADALQRGKNLTDGLNINSNQQMLLWLHQHGLYLSSLDKKARDDLLSKNIPSPVHQFLALKDIISKTSVKKYQTMIDTVCSDGRARGMFQFYGANRTGRWAGRLIQLQNLPQNHIADLFSARLFVAKKDIESLQLFFGNPSDVLSQLIRTAFIAPEGCSFIIADFSAIEARVIAWLANEKWR